MLYSHLASTVENETTSFRSYRVNIDRKDSMPTVHLLDYAAGNVRSLVNAIEKLGWQVEWIQTPDDVAKAEV